MTGIRGRGYSSDAYPTLFQRPALARAAPLGCTALPGAPALAPWDGRRTLGLFPFLFLGQLPAHRWESQRAMVLVSGR